MGFAWAPPGEGERDAMVPVANHWPPVGPWPGGGARSPAGRHASRRPGGARHRGRRLRPSGPAQGGLGRGGLGRGGVGRGGHRRAGPGPSWLSYFHRNA
jgi:hypothetical protein